MNVSLKYSGQTIAELSATSPAMPAASNVDARVGVDERAAVVGDPAVESRCRPAGWRSGAWARRRRPRSGTSANRCRPDRETASSRTTDTIFDSFDEMSAIVSETPRLVPIDCAIS